MYEAIKDFNNAIDTLEYVVMSITPIKSEEKIHSIYRKLTSDTSISLKEEAEEASYEIFISSLECILGYNRELALKYVYKLETRLTDIIDSLAYSFSPSLENASESLFTDSQEHNTVKEFIKDTEENISFLIDDLNEFAEVFLDEDTHKLSYFLAIHKASQSILDGDSSDNSFKVQIIKDRENYERLDKLSDNDSYYLAEIVAFGENKKMFYTSTKDLHHLLIRKRLPKHTERIHFYGEKTKGEAYRIGELLGLKIKEMQLAFEFDNGEITRNNKPKDHYHSDLSDKIEQLNKKYISKTEKSLLFPQNIKKLPLLL